MTKIIKRINQDNPKISIKEFVPITLKPEQVISDELSPKELLELQAQIKNKSPIERSLDKALKEISREYSRDLDKEEKLLAKQFEDEFDDSAFEELMAAAEKNRDKFIDNIQNSKIKVESKTRNQFFKDK